MRNLKKLAGALLAMVMVLSMCIGVSAAEEDSYTITVYPAYSGETYTAYKVFDATYNESGDVSYTINSSSPWYGQVSAATTVFELAQVQGSSTYVVSLVEDASVDEIVKTLTPVPEYAEAADAATPEFADNEDGSSGSGSVTLDVTASGAGYYYVTTSVGSVVSINTTNPEAIIEDKNPVPTLTKEVENVTHNGELEDNGDATEGTKDTAKVGDIIEFEIKIANAAHKSALCLHDYTSDGLSYYGSDHIYVYLNSVSASNKVSGDWYTIRDSECADGCDFEIEFSAEWLDDLKSTDVIIITYEAVVNENAATANTNDAFITYGTSGYSVIVETETDVYGLGLEKVDGNQNPLDGATFTLAYEDGTLIGFVKGTAIDEEGNATGDLYTVYDPEEHGEDYEPVTDIEIGFATIFGLDAGTYTLTETEAPDGYNKLTHSITVEINENGEVSLSTSSSSYASVEDGLITVVNQAGLILPGTGGMGTTIFYIIGVILVLGAGVLLITKRRMSKAE